MKRGWLKFRKLMRVSANWTDSLLLQMQFPIFSSMRIRRVENGQWRRSQRNLSNRGRQWECASDAPKTLDLRF